MATIEVLRGEVIDQIAAGEVVERPASVVKELVENALDAGAGQVTVEVESGGKDLVRVVDDGCGMSADQAALALCRHATSKLRALDDLFRLDTLGFRGEALPSIAAVSRLRLTTRPRGGEQEPASRLEVQGGRVVETREVGAPPGTSIEVRDLLYNVPARLKFLKGNATEASHITDTVSKLALANPAVHFKLRHGSRTALRAPACDGRFERVRAVLGKRAGERLHAAEGDAGGVRVEAFMAAPELSQTTSRGMQLFVGRRAVRDRGLLHAVLRGYGELLPRGRYPVAVVFVEVPQSGLDVNVHPQKLEVRFSDPQAVYAAVRRTVSRGAAEAPWLRESAFGRAAPVRMQALAAGGPPAAGPQRASELATSYAGERARMLFSLARPQREVELPLARREPVVPEAETPEAAAKEPFAPSYGPQAGAGRAAESLEPPGGFFTDLRYHGQLDRTYLLCEGEGELVLIDQHAAHERVEFQRLRERCERREIPVQRLLFPQTVEVDPGAAAVAGERQEELAALGFEVEPFGGRGASQSVALKAVPAGLRDGDPGRVLRRLLDELADRGGSRALEERLDLALATIACHSVVRAGDALSRREVEALLASMDAVDYRAHCPHGRPVLLRIGLGEIARRFGR